MGQGTWVVGQSRSMLSVHQLNMYVFRLLDVCMSPSCFQSQSLVNILRVGWSHVARAAPSEGCAIIYMTS